MRQPPQKLSAILVRHKKVCPSPLRPAAEGAFERVAQRVGPRRAFFTGGVAAVREHAAHSMSRILSEMSFICFAPMSKGERTAGAPLNNQASSPASSRFCLNSLRFLIAVMHAGMATAGRSSSSAQSIQSMPLMN